MPRDPDADELLGEHPDGVAATAQRLRTVLLDALGLDRTQLMATLAAGGFGGAVAP